jgi:hypothetical protein
MIKFPIQDIKTKNDEEYIVLKFITDDGECLLQCPCLNDKEVSIGSYWCKVVCQFNIRANNKKNNTVGCRHKYWFKVLEKEFYKNHGDKF